MQINKVSISNITKEVFNCFDSSLAKYDKKRVGSGKTVNFAMSCMAMFYFKWPSILQYEKGLALPNIASNVKRLFCLDSFPSDTQMRERIDEIDPIDLRSPFQRIFAIIQRNKFLERYAFMDGKYLLSIDGTGHFSSNAVHCDNCCVKNHRNGDVTYQHQMLGASLVHPDHKQVIPLAPEPILRQDGAEKNDCERNASKRLLEHLRREHPHLKLIIIEDALASNGPHLKLLKSLDMNYIIGVKPGDHKFLFDWVHTSKDKISVEFTDEDGNNHRFLFVNNVPLNDENFDFEVNFLEYWETKKNGKILHFSWVTDIELNKKNIFKISKGGRARWKIENETFNTLKNQGYNFEHNYGHGYNNLCTNMGMIMFLAFLIDQAQELCCRVFQSMRKAMHTYRALWEIVRSTVLLLKVDNFDHLYQLIVNACIHSDP